MGHVWLSMITLWKHPTNPSVPFFITDLIYSQFEQTNQLGMNDNLMRTSCMIHVCIIFQICFQLSSRLYNGTMVTIATVPSQFDNEYNSIVVLYGIPCSNPKIKNWKNIYIYIFMYSVTHINSYNHKYLYVHICKCK